MRKLPTKPQSNQPKTLEPRTLSDRELQQISGGGEEAQVMKTRHDTIKNT